MQTVFIDSKEEGWKELREVVTENPLLDDDGQLSCRGFARFVSSPKSM